MLLKASKEDWALLLVRLQPNFARHATSEVDLSCVLIITKACKEGLSSQTDDRLNTQRNDESHILLPVPS